MANSMPLAIVPRDHFMRDPMFQDCWTILQEERQKEARRSFYLETNPYRNVTIPWKWNTVGRMKELFTEPPDMERSCEVDACKWYYKILLDVQHFQPEDLTIALTMRTVVIKGKHEEKADLLGAVSRQFTRKYILPSDAIMEHIECHLSSDGVLHLTAPRTYVHGLIGADDILHSKDVVKHSFPPIAIEDFDTSSTSNGNQENVEKRGVEAAPSTEDIDGRSIQTIPDFDMVPFWARELPANSPFGIKSDLHNFKVVIDLSQFAPEEVNVYSTKFYIKVEGKHEEKQDPHGFITRNFSRKYWLPAGVKTADVKCSLSNAGVLEIMAPMPKHNHGELEKAVRLPVVLIEEARDQKWYNPELI